MTRIACDAFRAICVELWWVSNGLKRRTDDGSTDQMGADCPQRRAWDTGALGGGAPCASALAAGGGASAHAIGHAGGSLRGYTHLDAAEVDAYSRRFGRDHVADAVEIATGGKQDLIVVHQPPSHGGLANMIITVVEPNRRLYNFSVDAQSGGAIRKAMTRSGEMAAVFAQAGAHTQRLYVLAAHGGQPSLIGRFSGDSGVTVWLQGGQLEIATNNSTGVMFKGANGRPDEKARVTLTRYNGSAFASVGGFTDGVFQYEPSMQTSPQYDAAAFIEQRMMGCRSMTTWRRFRRNWAGLWKKSDWVVLMRPLFESSARWPMVSCGWWNGSVYRGIESRRTLHFRPGTAIRNGQRAYPAIG